MLEIPITAKVVPILVAGWLVVADPTPIADLAHKITTTTIDREVTNTDTGYNERVTIVKDENIPDEKKKQSPIKTNIIDKKNKFIDNAIKIINGWR